MKLSRGLTVAGSVLLIASAGLHMVGYAQLKRWMHGSPPQAPMDVILKASWFFFALQWIFTAILAWIASSMNRGGRIVMLCAASTAATAALLFHFLGAFIGVYFMAAVTPLLAIGGYLQSRETA